MDLCDLNNTRRTIPEPELKELMRQVVAGLEYLHDNHVAHRDIKSEYILIFGEGRNIAKLTDYSLVREADEHTISKSYLGTEGYKAPELYIRALDIDVFKLDIWAVGVTIYLCLTMSYLPDWEPKEAMIVSRRIKSMNPMMNMYTKMISQVVTCGKSEQVIDLMKGMLDIRVEDRLDIKETKTHPWFTGAPQAAYSAESIVQLDEDGEVIRRVTPTDPSYEALKRSV